MNYSILNTGPIGEWLKLSVHGLTGPTVQIEICSNNNIRITLYYILNT